MRPAGREQDNNDRPARVKKSHLDVRESALSGRAFSPGAIEDAFARRQEERSRDCFARTTRGRMGRSGRRASDERDALTARPIVAPKRARSREFERVLD